MPTRHQVLLAESADEVGAYVLIKEPLEQQIGPVDHIDHKPLHLLIAEARELGLGGQFKSGQLGSFQNRPTEVARNC